MRDWWAALLNCELTYSSVADYKFLFYFILFSFHSILFDTDLKLQTKKSITNGRQVTFVWVDSIGPQTGKFAVS